MITTTPKRSIAPIIPPVEEDTSTDFFLTVGGQPVTPYIARVSAHPLNQVWPGYQRPKSQTENASFASWDMIDPVEVVVVSTRPVQTVQIRPLSAGITPQVDDQTLRFTVTKPGQYTVEVNGSHQSLHLFANPPEEHAPDPSTPGLVYFGPGVHCPGLIHLMSGQRIYLAPGAVVYGAILAEKAENITIQGRGILDGSKFDRMDLTGLICLYDCANISIEGITLRDSGVFTVVPIASREVHISNVKVIGNWRYNSDGIDFINCQSCSVEDSFIRAFDDCVCLKGYESFGSFIYRLQLMNGQTDGTFTLDGVERQSFAEFQRRFGIYSCGGAAIHDFQVRRCVLWCDWGRALEIGAETVAEEIRDVRFEDCDIIHAAHIAMDVQNSDHALCRDILFRDIRVEMDDAPQPPVIQQHKDQDYVAPCDGYLPHLIVLENIQGYVSFGTVHGRIEDIRFEDIQVTAPLMPPSRLSGFDAESLVQRVSIANLRLNGEVVSDMAASSIATNEFVREVTVRVKGKGSFSRLLFLGNSITCHAPKLEIGWSGDWGMAASTREKDYVHLLLQRFTSAADGITPEVRIENIADFEREYATCDLAQFDRLADFQADTLILAIGENVPTLATDQDQGLFRSAVRELLARVSRKGKPAIYVRSTFWPDPIKDVVLRQVCNDMGGTFVDISQLAADERNYARSECEFTHDGVAAHPGDAGMSAIAGVIWNAVWQDILEDRKR